MGMSIAEGGCPREGEQGPEESGSCAGDPPAGWQGGLRQQAAALGVRQHRVLARRAVGLKFIHGL